MELNKNAIWLREIKKDMNGKNKQADFAGEAQEDTEEDSELKGH